MLILDILRVIWGLVRIVLVVAVVWRFIPYRKTMTAGLLGWLAWKHPEMVQQAAVMVGHLTQ